MHNVLTAASRYPVLPIYILYISTYDFNTWFYRMIIEAKWYSKLKQRQTFVNLLKPFQLNLFQNSYGSSHHGIPMIWYQYTISECSRYIWPVVARWQVQQVMYIEMLLSDDLNWAVMREAGRVVASHCKNWGLLGACRACRAG